IIAPKSLRAGPGRRPRPASPRPAGATSSRRRGACPRVSAPPLGATEGCGGAGRGEARSESVGASPAPQSQQQTELGRPDARAEGNGEKALLWGPQTQIISEREIPRPLPSSLTQQDDTFRNLSWHSEVLSVCRSQLVLPNSRERNPAELQRRKSSQFELVRRN
ncbi:hypothetical protein MC885_014211, partial [Smutsia gigantea]